MTPWTAAAASVTILETLAGLVGLYSLSKRPLYLFIAYTMFLIPFRVTWLLAPMDTPAACPLEPPPLLAINPRLDEMFPCLRPPWTLWLLDGARVVVTLGAIRLLLWSIPWGNGERPVRWRWALVLGFGAAVLAMAVHSTWFGLVRVVCFVALVTAIGFSAAWRHPTIPFQAKYAGIMAVYLGSSAFASLAKSVRGDPWDTAACGVQALCAVAWILMLRGKI